MMFQDGNQQEWNPAVMAAGGVFTQSWEWGMFQEATNRPVERIIGTDAGVTVHAQVMTMPLPRGLSYWYIPRGPVWTGTPSAAAWDAFRVELARRARATGKVFLRVDPVANLATGFPVSATQPQHTSIVDVTRPDDALRAAMHQKTRYNIRVAEKKGVQVIEQTSEEGLAAFLQLTRETAERHGIHPEPEAYFHTMFNTLAVPGTPDPKRCTLKFFVATWGGKPVAVSLALLFGTTMTYAHGASSDAYKNVMAPYLLHWTGMRYAREYGYEQYDFRGIAPLGAGAGHHWAGITRFKEGFGGARVAYPQSSDYPYRFLWYPIYRIGALLKHRKV